MDSASDPDSPKEVDYQREPLLDTFDGRALICTIVLARDVSTVDVVAPDPRYKNHHLNRLLKQTSAYSPILDEVDLSLRPTTLEGLLHDNSSIFRQAPSPEVDRAWQLFASNGTVFTTSSYTIVQSQKDPSALVQVPESWGQGEDAFLVQWDVFHQIHCLNWLRKDLNWKYYFGDSEPSERWLLHRAHCVHMLLQTLMCHADLEPIPYEWMTRETGAAHAKNAVPSPDFSVIKMCRNWNAIVEWAENHKVPDAKEKRKLLDQPGPGVPIKHWNET